MCNYINTFYYITLSVTFMIKFIPLTGTMIAFTIYSKGGTMKKCILFIFFIAIAILLVSGESKQDFDNTVDFSVTFKDLFDGVNSGKSFDTKKFIVIDGSITARIVVNKEEDNFIAELELVNGEWEGLEEVEIYKCFVVLKGSDFLKRIPVKRSRKKLPNEIELNSRVLVIGKIISTRKDDEGLIIPVLEVIYVRPL